MKFIISFSGGKDSTLALYKMLSGGHEAVGLLVMINKEQERSWFHGVDIPLLEQIAKAVGIPLILCPSAGEDYYLALEEGLRQGIAKGAEACVFGDIDAEDNAAWCRARCEAVGIAPVFPLWGRDRGENTKEVIDLGFDCIIKCVRNGVLPQSFLGRRLDEEVVREMETLGVDVCGEGGEYHTVVLGGPVFAHPVSYQCREILDFGTISAINIVAAKADESRSCTVFPQSR